MTRVVVTGRDASGTSVVLSDELLDGFTPVVGLTVMPLWSNEVSLGEGADRNAQLVPAPGGCRVTAFSVAPGANGPYHQFVADHLGPYVDPDRTGMHGTPTQDYIAVLDGAVLLELDEGSVELSRGDIVVQNGTMHRWSNIGDTTATLLIVMLRAMS